LIGYKNVHRISSPFYRIGLFAIRFAVILTLVIVTGCQRDEHQPGIISGGSMAPALLGRHYEVSCGDCKFVFACDGINIPADRQTVCPNCGFAQNELEPAQFVPADRVTILPAEQLKRWDIVAVTLGNQSDESPQYAVKRIVALPDEELRFEHGDVLIDGAVAAKPLDVQKSVRIPVFDSDYRRPSDNSLAKRMIRVPSSSALDDKSSPVKSLETLAGRKTSSVVDVENKIRFQPITGYRSKEAGEPVRVIKDFYAYNQKLSRKLNTVDQLFLQFDILAEPNVPITIQVLGSYPVRISLNVESVDLEQDIGTETHHQSFEMPPRNGVGLKIEISNFDRRLYLVVNDCKIFDIESLADPGQELGGNLIPLELEVAGGSCRLNRLQIWRDIYYFDQGSHYFSQTEPWRTGESEYFLLGDNVPISVDSRHWGNPSVSHSQIMGVVSQTP
jgi:signal peptidase I